MTCKIWVVCVLIIGMLLSLVLAYLSYEPLNIVAIKAVQEQTDEWMARYQREHDRCWALAVKAVKPPDTPWTYCDGP